MRSVIIWLSVAIAGTLLGGAIGGCIGWQIGSYKLRHHPDEAVRTAYWAGEGQSEDVVPQALLTLIGGFFGCFVGGLEGIGFMIRWKRRDVVTVNTGSSDAHQHSLTLFD